MSDRLLGLLDLTAIELRKAIGSPNNHKAVSKNVQDFFSYLDSAELRELRNQKSLIRAISISGVQRWLYAFPVKKESGIFISVGILSDKSVDFSFGLLGSNKHANSPYSLSVVDSHKNLLSAYGDNRMSGATILTNHPLIRFAMGNTAVAGSKAYEFNGISEFGAFKKISQGGLVVISSVKKDFAFARVQWVKRTISLISLIIVALACLVAYLFSNAIIRPIKLLVQSTQDVDHGNLNVSVLYNSLDEIGVLIGAFNRMVVGLRERKRLSNAMSKFVSEDVAKIIADKELELGGELKKVTILFSDIRSFTAMSEKMSPDELMHFLNEYMTIMVDAIQDQKGTVDKFIGDAIMAVWGAPVGNSDDAENAVNSALHMRAILKKYNVGRGTRARPKVHIGIGINTGNVLAGHMGSMRRFEYTVVGDPVNLASRLEDLNKKLGTDILISANTYKEVRSLFHCIHVPNMRVRGKAQPQDVYIVLRRIDDGSGPKNLKELRRLIGSPIRQSKK